MKTADGFTRMELVFVTGAVTLVAAVPLLGMTRHRDKVFSSMDLRNVREILVATEEYRANNNDLMPHPTWGGIPGGADGWAYATQNNGRIPGGPPSIPNLKGSFDRERQMPFFGVGQLASYLRPEVLECPSDVAERAAGPQRAWYLERPQKITSYTWSGAVVGPVKGSEFLPRDIFIWEADETSPFNFNDAASNPVNRYEGISQRHLGSAPKTAIEDVGGGGVAGRFDGSAELMRWTEFVRLRESGEAGQPNDLLCGPMYR